MSQKLSRKQKTDDTYQQRENTDKINENSKKAQ